MAEMFKYRVLYVDDEPIIRQSAQLILKKQNYEVLVAEDGLDALQCLRGPLPELLITDLRMPRMSGFELLAVVRKRFPQIRTMAISGEYVTSAANEGILADMVLQKGRDSIEEYLRKVQDLLMNPPARPFPGTQMVSPIWVPLHGSGEILITCPHCLRSLEIDGSDLEAGIHKAQCTSCNCSFEFNVDDWNVEAVRKGTPLLREG